MKTTVNDVNNLNGLHDEQYKYKYTWIKDTCEIYDIKYERVLELIEQINQQIYGELNTEIENMKNMNSKFHAKQQLKHLINNNNNK